MPPPDVSTALSPGGVRVKVVERNAVAIVCGDDVATAGRYEAQNAELKRLALALCGPDANPAARIAAIQLAGERGYGEALPVLRGALAAPRRNAALDIVAIGSIGLLGDSSDIPRLSHFIKCDSRRAFAAGTAIRRINERSGTR